MIGTAGRYRFHPDLGYDGEDYVWKVHWNELAEGGPLDAFYPPWYDVEDLMDRAGRLTDGYSIVSFGDEVGGVGE